MEGYKSGPLSHVKVLDLTHLVAGPYCTMLLSDAGARVTKIEPPGGELSHHRGAIRTLPSGQTVSSYILAFNRGKESIAIDLKSDPGRDVFMSLLR
jgi:crotonobetainyl-CoA:carnitine CoA-transferase CaiB-like acyl-CoA transferase